MNDYSLYFFKNNGVYEASVFAESQDDAVTLLNQYLKSINEAFGYTFASVTRSNIYSASGDTPEGCIIGVHEFVIQERSEAFHVLNVMAINNRELYGYYKEQSVRLIHEGLGHEITFNIGRESFDLVTSKKSRVFLFIANEAQYNDVQNHLKGTI